jgi:hypothetical protein
MAPISKIVVAVVVTVLTAIVAPARAQAPAKKPNILVIWGDDIGVYNLSAYNLGVMGYHTPNIDRIAREGACSPTPMRSRAAPRAAPRSSSVSIPSARVC